MYPFRNPKSSPAVKEGEEFELFNYKIKVMKVNQTLPEMVEVRLITTK